MTDAPERITVKPLNWDVDGRSLRLDATMSMGKGYDWEGFELCRQEAYGLGCGYIIWPDSISSKVFSLYGTADGLYIQNLDGEDAAKQAAQDDWNSKLSEFANVTPTPAPVAGWRDMDSAPNWEGFGRALLEDWPTGDIEGSFLFDMALKYALIREIPGGYDPDQHEDVWGIYPEPGDAWYEYAFGPESAPGQQPDAVQEDELRQKIKDVIGYFLHHPSFAGRQIAMTRRANEILRALSEGGE